MTATDASVAANGGPFTSPARTLALTVSSPTVAVSTTTLPAATFNTSYTAPALSAVGGTAPYIFAATGLPSGLTLNPASGVISGTPTQAGIFNIAVTATDATTAANGGPFVSAAKSVSLSVAAPAISVSTATLPAATFGVTYTSPALAASGGAGPYTYAATGLPAGLTIAPSTGVISGTPTQAGTFTVSATATDATAAADGGPFVSPARSLTIAVAAPTIILATSSLPGATFGSTYTAPALVATGGMGPYAFAATGLPSGLTLNPTTGVISGIATQSGTFTISATATDATTAANGGPFVSAARTMSLVVGAPTIAVTVSTLSPAVFGMAYTAPAIAATGGTGPYTFAVTGLPAGVSVNAQTGVISGTPSQAGTFAASVTVTDATTAANGGPFVSAATAMTLVVGTPTVAVAAPILPAATFGTAYVSPAFTASGGSGPYVFTATGLPSGLTINPSTGVISGTPSQAGAVIFSVTATDATPAASGGPFRSGALSATLVVQAPAIAISTASLPTATFGQSYAGPVLAASGGTMPYAFAATGLPAGLSLNPATAAISGTPSVAGRFTVQVTATDSTLASNGGPFVSPQKALTLDVSPPTLAVVTASLPPATAGMPYTSPSFIASGGTAPYSFAVTGLPNGLSYSPTTGRISGTPTTAGTVNVSITATDATAAAHGGPFVSTAKTLQLVTAPAVSAVALSSSANPAAAGSVVTFTARVSPVTATGTIRFSVGTQTIGSAPLVAGAATLSVSTLAVGAQSIIASYGGDASTAGAVSSPLNQSITGTPQWTASLTASPQTYSAAGQSISVTYLLRNTGNVAITGVALTDARIASIACPQTSVAPGASLTCSGRLSTTAADVAAGLIAMTATARGTSSAGSPADAIMRANLTYVPTTGTVAIVVSNTGRDGRFGIKTTMPGAESFNLTTVGGAASRTFSNVPSGSYTISLGSLPAGSKRTTLRCNGVDQAGSSAAIAISGNTTVSCTFGVATDGEVVSSAARTEAKAFIARRASTLTSAQPDRMRQFSRLAGSLFGGTDEEEVQDVNAGNAAMLPTASLRGSVQGAPGSAEWQGEGSVATAIDSKRPVGSPPMGVGAAPSTSPFSVSGSLEDGNGRINGSTSVSQMIAASLMSNSAASGRGARSTGRLPGLRGDIWAEVQSTHFMDPRDSGRRGSSTIGFVGADYVIHPAFLIGALVQVDVTNETQNGKQATGGTGWMAGPYVATKLTRNLMFDARAAWGKSTNQLVYLGRDDDQFNTSRSLYMGRLSGNWQNGLWRFSPEIAVSYFKEAQEAFTTTDGVAVAAQSLDYGRVTFGPEIGYAMRLPNSWRAEPSIGIKGLWNFRDAERQGTSMDLRIEAGVRLEAPAGMSLRASGSYQGFSDGNPRAVNGQIQVGVPFN